MRDAKVTATPTVPAGTKDDVAFTVLWVDVTVATAGTVSANNDKKNNYQGWTVGNNVDLKLQRYNSSMGSRMGWGTEARGAVSPADFTYPGSDLKLERDYEYFDYENGVVTARANYRPRAVSGRF